MHTGQQRRRWKCGGAMLAAACILGLAASAQARTEQVRWQHPNPSEVASFTVHVGASSGTYTQQINAGIPVVQNGAYVFNLSVADTADIYIAISARGTNGLRSPLSNERFRAGNQTPPPATPLGTPGKPLVISP